MYNYESRKIQKLLESTRALSDSNVTGFVSNGQLKYSPIYTHIHTYRIYW